MVVVNLAFTSPVNPPKTEPVITVEQLWTGLVHKVREPQLFIPAIAECKVVEERDNVVVREVVFKEGMGPPGTVKEVCTCMEPAVVTFEQPNGSMISNIISKGAGGVTDLYLTYAFSWQHPEISKASDEERAVLAKYEPMAQQAVEMSVESVRKMVKEGNL